VILFLLSRALAGEAGVPFFYTNGSQFDEVFVGVGAKRVNELFEKAQSYPKAIIFIDEVDAIGLTRDAFYSRQQTLNELLTRMDGFEQNSGLIILAATNRPDILDPALTRSGRFDRKISVFLPGLTERKALFEYYLRNDAPDVDIDAVSKLTIGLSGADIANIVNCARIETAKVNEKFITSKLLEDAREIILSGRRKNMVITEETRKNTAYHESGHTLLAYYSSYKNLIEKVSLIPRGEAYGATHILPKSEYLQSLDYIESRINTLMGGRAAEEIIYGSDHVTLGAADDIKKATQLAEQSIVTYGMYDTHNALPLKQRSDESKHKVEVQISNILTKAYKKKSFRNISSS